MKRSTRCSGGIRGRSLKLIVSFFLLAVYFVANLEVFSLHTLIHDNEDQQTLHSEINEGNSCHKSLFHNAAGNSCDHKTHLLAAKKCSLCQLSIQSFHLAESKSPAQIDFSTEVKSDFGQIYFEGDSYLYQPLRAPPIS